MSDIKVKNTPKAVFYILTGALALAVALPLAIATNNSDAGDLFVECFDAECDDAVIYADLKD